MKYFLDENQALRAIENDGSQDFLITEEWKKITDAEADEIRNNCLTYEQTTAQKVQEANAFLKATDWVEPFIIAHKMGIEGYLLSADSNKLIIDAQRNEARNFLRANS